MTYPSSNGGHPLADLDPTDAELDALAEVMAELGDYPPGYEPPDDDDGPWDDELRSRACGGLPLPCN